jgi:K319L-like, PKD domain/Fibronectin type III domain
MVFNARPYSTSFQFLFYFLLVIIAFISYPNFSAAVTQVTLAWDKNNEPDVAGYSLYSRQAGETYNYNSPEWEGNDTSCTIYNLIDKVDYCFVVRAYDTDGNESADSNEICIANVRTNQGPIADAGDDQNVESGAMVSLNGSNSIDFDDGIASFVWKQLNDSPIVKLSYDPLKPEATFLAPNGGPDGANLTFELTVTDFGGLQGSDTCTVFVKAAANDQPDTASTVHIGDLEGTSFKSRRNRWKASVDVEVHDNNCDLVDGATVSGIWSGGYTGSGSCITQDGICSLTSGDINTRKSQTKFTIKNISSSAFTYDPTENHDLDGDSDGSNITISRP